MKFELTNKEKSIVFFEVESQLKSLGLGITGMDATRPWGGFFVIDEEHAHQFGQLFFPGEDISGVHVGTKLSPKILLVQPGMRLSWQYHHRRAEIWRVVSGKAGVITSDTDQEGKLVELRTGETVRLAQGQRHPLVGMDEWGIIAEIWQLTDTVNPSDEQDIVTLQDDFGR